MDLLKEVREHLDLLKQFEGSVDAEALTKRKRELFAAMPPAPPPLGARDMQVADSSDDRPAAKKARLDAE